MGRKRLFAGTLVCSCVLSFGGCMLPQEEARPAILVKEETVKAYEMTPVVRGDIRKTKTLTAVYQQVNTENLSFSVNGRRLAGVYVSVGDTVKTGELLAELYCDEERELLAELEYEIMTQKIELEHLEEQKGLKLAQLAKRKDSMTKAQYEAQAKKIADEFRLQMEDLEDALYIEEMQYESYKAYVDGCTLYADMDGTVTYLGYTGSSFYSRAGYNLITVSDSSVCAFQCSETDYIPYFTAGEVYTFVTSAGVEYETTLAEADAATGTFRFKLLETQYGLPIGLRVLYSLTLDEKKDVLYLPKNAVHFVDGRAYVYYIGEDGIRQMKYISVGMEADAQIEIIDGLAEGEEVILR